MYNFRPVTGQLSDICTPVQLIYNYNLVMCVLCIISYVIIGAIVVKKGGYKLKLIFEVKQKQIYSREKILLRLDIK